MPFFPFKNGSKYVNLKYIQPLFQGFKWKFNLQLCSYCFSLITAEPLNL